MIEATRAVWPTLTALDTNIPERHPLLEAVLRDVGS
jgi:hypothetical protein